MNPPFQTPVGSSVGSSIKPFAEQGNYIAMHRVLFDDVMPLLSPGAWKVLCFLVRKTIGWHKEFDVISYSQIQVGTGIKSRSAVSGALHELQGQVALCSGRRIQAWLPAPDKPQLINAYKGVRRSDGTLETTCYSLNADFEIEPSFKPGLKPSIKPSFEPGLKNGHGAAQSEKQTDNNTSPLSNSKSRGVAAPALSSSERYSDYPRDSSSNHSSPGHRCDRDSGEFDFADYDDLFEDAFDDLFEDPNP